MMQYKDKWPGWRLARPGDIPALLEVGFVAAQARLSRRIYGSPKTQLTGLYALSYPNVFSAFGPGGRIACMWGVVEQGDMVGLLWLSRANTELFARHKMIVWRIVKDFIRRALEDIGYLYSYADTQDKDAEAVRLLQHIGCQKLQSSFDNGPPLDLYFMGDFEKWRQQHYPLLSAE